MILRGSIPADLVLSEAFITGNITGVRYAEVVDRTEPTLDFDKYAAEPGIRGAFCRAMLPKLTEGTEKDKLIAAKALKAGLDALNGRG